MKVSDMSKTSDITNRSYNENEFTRDLDVVLNDLRELLVDKNKRYGDSALNPVRIFSKADPLEQLNVRIDDKISRMFYGGDCDPEDVKKDLTGYFILQRVAEIRAEREKNKKNR